MTSPEFRLEATFIEKLVGLKYVHRQDVRDRGALEANFREKFQALNHVKLTDAEFERLLAEIVTPGVFTAAHTLRNRNSFTRDDGTPLNYTLVNVADWCKNTFEVVSQLRVNTDNSHHRYDVLLLINGVPVVQVELKTLGINPRRAIEQIVDYKNDPGNGYTRTILCFVQLFVVSNRDSTYYFANNNARHFAFDADERFLPIYEHASPDNTKVRGLDAFADAFLAKCTLGHTVSRYMVLVATEQKLLMMRPYQIYAVKNIVRCIEENRGNGFVWHTTGSGKTLTSFKASTLLKAKAQLFGFTGTPIFEANAAVRRITGDVQTLRTTEDLFQHRLHEYTITHAIEDGNVLRFHVDYYKPEGANVPKPGEKLAKAAVVNAILDKHDAATGGRRFNALLATGSINDAIDYYNLFQSMQVGRKMADPAYVPLNVAAVFSPPADVSPDVKQIQEDLVQEAEDNKVDPEAKKKALAGIIADYNARYGTNHRIEEFDQYYQDVQKRIKDQQYSKDDFAKIDPEGKHQHKIDLTIVVDMLLTGFDSKYLNTLYVDKNLKVSRGEENIFIWCFFLAIVQLVLDKAEAYKWVRYIYIDDPISSLDDNNAVMVAHHLAQMLKDAPEPLRVVVSSHHVLFFNVLCNEMKKPRKYFLTREAQAGGFTVRETDSTPFLYHLASLVELHAVQKSGALYTHHFNMLRRVMEQTACFFGYEKWDDCIKPEDDDPKGTVYKRVIDLMSHGDYSLYEPREMLPENKEHFGRVLTQFLARHPFSPALFPSEAK